MRFSLRELFLAKIEYLEVSFELKFQKKTQKVKLSDTLPEEYSRNAVEHNRL